jgi:hydrogenase-4 component B
MSTPDLSGGFAWLCGAALFSWLIATVIGFIQRRNPGPLLQFFLALGGLLLLISAISGGNWSVSLPLPFYLGDAGFNFVADPLARWFLGIIGLICIPTAFFTPGYMHHLREHLSVGLVWSMIALLMISMTGVIISGNALIFLVCWEVMALSSFALVAADHEHRAIRKAAFIYLGATRTGTAFLMGGFLWVHALTGTWTFADWHLSGPVAIGPALLIFIGLAVKAGCWPFHLWLPIAHPAAPAPVSAVMSGVMIKTAIYAMIRLFIVDEHIVTAFLGPLILILGSISAVWGILFALLQRDLKRLLAYSSVENIGIILMGIGIAILGRQWNIELIAQVGLAAALFHALNHAVFKSLLFMGTGAIDAGTHIRDIDKLGGLIRNMPWTVGAFIVGSVAICALPPLNGFAGEWLLYKGFFSMALLGPTVEIRLGALLLMGILALVGALVIACFVKAVGISMLGMPRSSAAENAKEATRGMVIAQVFLAFLCVALGVTAPLFMTPLSSIVTRANQLPLLQNNWSIPIIAISIAIIAGIGLLTAWMIKLAKKNPSRHFITWECGFGKLGPRTQYTGSSFSQPIAQIFGAIYNYAVDITIKGKQRRHFPEKVSAEMNYEAYLETRIYLPLIHTIKRLSGNFLMRLQAGSIHQYFIHMALVLALLIWVGSR